MTPWFSDATAEVKPEALADHWWHGYPIGDGDGSWVCSCGAYCDHERPCGRHGRCHRKAAA